MRIFDLKIPFLDILSKSSSALTPEYNILNLMNSRLSPKSALNFFPNTFPSIEFFLYPKLAKNIFSRRSTSLLSFKIFKLKLLKDIFFFDLIIAS